MAENSERNGIHEVVINLNNEVSNKREDSSTYVSVPFLQKLVAEVVGTYFLIFAGCAAVVVNKNNDSVVTLPGIAMVWGLAVMVLIYSVGHISGAHFNPAVTIAFATTRRFPLKQNGELAGIAIGSTILMIVIFAGPLTGASMNPARSIGPAIVHHEYTGIWIYLVSPSLGAVAGAWVYNIIRHPDNSRVRVITHSASFLNEAGHRGGSN